MPGSHDAWQFDTFSLSWSFLDIGGIESFLRNKSTRVWLCFFSVFFVCCCCCCLCVCVCLIFALLLLLLFDKC